MHGRTAHLAKLVVANHFFANFTPTRHLTREPFKLHVGTEARRLQRPDPQIPAITPPQACRVRHSGGGEYGRGWTNSYRLWSALVVRTPSFAVAGARSPATPSFPRLGRFVDAPPRRRLAWTPPRVVFPLLLHSIDAIRVDFELRTMGILLKSFLYL